MTPFPKGANSVDGTVHRRGPDRVPRIARSLLLKALYAEGPIHVWERNPNGKGMRKIKKWGQAAALHNLTARVQRLSLSDDPRVLLALLELIGDRIDGKATAGIVVQPQRVTQFIFARAPGETDQTEKAGGVKEPNKTTPAGPIVDPGGEEFVPAPG